MATRTLIDRIKESLAKQGFEMRSREARNWLKAKTGALRPTKADLMRDKQRLRDKSFIGRMYFYFYDPKTKDTLPYYDKFPLVIPIERYPDGFLGLNLHYQSIQMESSNRILQRPRLGISSNYGKASRYLR